MYQGNLSYRLLCRYLDEVLDAGLVSFEKEECYVLTARGKEFLNRDEEYSKRCKSLEEHLAMSTMRRRLWKECVSVQPRLITI